MNDTEQQPKSRFRTFRKLFPLVVLSTFLILFLIEHSRPSRSELPVFEPTERVALEPLQVPLGEVTLRGKTLTADGATAPGVLVELVQDGQPHWTYSDEDGLFELPGLDAGSTTASLTQLNSPPSLHDVELPSQPVEWRLAAEYTTLDALPPGQRSSLFGNLISPFDSPVEGCQLVLQPTAENPPFSVATLRRVPVGKQGAYAIADLALGHYEVYVLPPWAEGGTWPRLVSRNYEHLASAANLDLTLESGELEGVLLLDSETPLTGAQVLAWNASQPDQLWEPQTTDQAGKFKLVDLPGGTYTVEVRAGGTSLTKNITITPKRRATIDFGPISLSE